MTKALAKRPLTNKEMFIDAETMFIQQNIRVLHRAMTGWKMHQHLLSVEQKKRFIQSLMKILEMLLASLHNVSVLKFGEQFDIHPEYIGSTEQKWAVFLNAAKQDFVTVMDVLNAKNEK